MNNNQRALPPTTRHFDDVVGFYGIMGKHFKWAFLDLRSFCFNELVAGGAFLFHFLPYLFNPISAFPLSLDFYLARANKLTENPACYLLIRKNPLRRRSKEASFVLVVSLFPPQEILQRLSVSHGKIFDKTILCNKSTVSFYRINAFSYKVAHLKYHFAIFSENNPFSNFIANIAAAVTYSGLAFNYATPFCDIEISISMGGLLRIRANWCDFKLTLCCSCCCLQFLPTLKAKEQQQSGPSIIP